MRREILDLEAFQSDLKARMTKRQHTNFFLSEKNLAQKFEEGKISVQSFGESIYIFIKEENREEVYYFLDKSVALQPILSNGLPLVLSLVQIEGKEVLPSYDDWMRIGFQPYLTRKRLFFKIQEKEQREVTVADEKWLESIFALMQSSFEPFTSALPTKEELLLEIQSGNVIIATEGSLLLGFLHFETTKKTSFLWHIAVDRNARGKGIGNRLVRDWMSHVTAQRFTLWVRLDNPSALRMYEKLGFQSDGRLAPVMIKREDEEK